MIKLIAILLITAFATTALAQAPRRIGIGSSSLSSRGPRRRAARIAVSPECVGITTRTITGFCTNDADPTLGESRRAQASYFNVSTQQPADQNLPSPRLVSNIVSAQEGPTENSHGLNEMFTFFGQFIDHDFALSPAKSIVHNFKYMHDWFSCEVCMSHKKGVSSLHSNTWGKLKVAKTF
ncbi:hypothetical protein BWQ96_06720 [Gracilariopsis chorda]|uniref:Uncharacterized protein n=1 Tax=Gracilariopsis chorda TaxID=448386 RepID=A0A2V3IN96_9FLOR|nr:hypothetical protein BWQ96_06720 [Gracilariopsis chorda]|eukprot:PXF43543.1 hypothetical protein BWQ96_06720 [Gracilariopsis chorda]